jgi:AraC family ethanolamine operon transcriptional activator
MMSHPQCNGRAVCVELGRVDHLEEVLQDWSAQVLQLEPGDFGAHVDVLTLPDITVRRCTTNRPLACRLSVPNDTVLLIRPLPGSSPMLWRGYALEQDECLVLPGGAEAEIVTREMHSHVSITCRLGHAASCVGTSALCVDLRASALGTARQLFRAADALLHVGCSPPVLAADDVVAAVSSMEEKGGEPMTGASSARRALAVRKARAFIHANHGASLRLSDLCRQAHAQARTLEYGFREILGITPIAYLKVLRLHRARERLRDAGTRQSVTQIALECGFCHLSQFSMDYRRQFGERPSDTRRRGLNGGHERRDRR